MGLGRSWGAAYDAAGPGDVLVLGPGEHGMERVVRKDVAIVGACPERTRLRGASFASPGLLADVSVASAAAKAPGILVQDAGGEVRLDGVRVDDAFGDGIVAIGHGVLATLHDVAVRNVGHLDNGKRGFCVSVEDDAQVRAQGLRLGGCAALGLRARAGADVAVTDLVFRGAGASTGADADDRARLTLTRAVIDDVGTVGVVSGGPAGGGPAEVSLGDVRIRGGAATLVAVAALAAGTVRARRVWVEGPVGIGLGVEGPGLVAAEDAVVLAPGQRVVSVQAGGELTADRLYAEAWGSGRVGATPGDKGDAAVVVIGSGSEAGPVRLTDAVLLRGEALAMEIQASQVVLERVLVGGVRDLGLFLSGGRLQADDVHVLAMRSDERIAGGHALLAQEGARLEGRRVRVEGARDAALIAFGDPGADTVLALSDLAVLGTRKAECAELAPGERLSCAYADGRDEGGGLGIVSMDGAKVRLDGFEVRDSALAGVVVARDAASWTCAAAS